MAQKSLPPSAKQALILTHLRQTRTCHTLKDLEKALPSVASINSMQVKEYIQVLVDDSQLRVEKIGSGNWYWTFGSEEKKEKEKLIASLNVELEKVDKVVKELEERIEAAKPVGDTDFTEREELVQTQRTVGFEVDKLKREEEAFVDAGVGGVERKKGEVCAWKIEADAWTDNLYVLETYLLGLAGGDKEALEGVKRSIYGGVVGEWSEEEGLRELV